MNFHSENSKYSLLIGPSYHSFEVQCELIVQRLAKNNEEVPTFKSLYDSIRVKVVSDIQISPYRRVAYLNPLNIKVFRIMLSSELRTDSVNDTSIASIVKSSKSEVHISPLAEGFAKLNVIDSITMPPSQQSAFLTVSEAHHLELIGGGDVQIGENLLLFPRVYDLNGRRF